MLTCSCKRQSLEPGKISSLLNSDCKMNPCLMDLNVIFRYYLYSSLPSSSNLEEEFFSLSPGGLANGKKGNDYQGHVFWDTVSTLSMPMHFLIQPVNVFITSRKPGCYQQFFSLDLNWSRPAWTTEFAEWTRPSNGQLILDIREQGSSLATFPRTEYV